MSIDMASRMVAFRPMRDLLGQLPKLATYYFCKADIPRGLDALELQVRAKAHGLAGDSYPSVQAAFVAARTHAGQNDLVLITGSVFVVAEVI